MNILSLFDGVSCAQVALHRVGIPVDNYYASEVDRYAISITQKHFPDTLQIGDIKNIPSAPLYILGNIDLMIGGFPCQDLSIAYTPDDPKLKNIGLNGSRSGLFWEMLKIHRIARPKYFIYENVASMKKSNRDIITDAISNTYGSCIEPICIDAALVSAQSRKRLFWTNIPNVTQPKDRKILLKNILLDGIPSEYNRDVGLMTGREKAKPLCASDYRGLNRRQTQTCVQSVQIGHLGTGGKAGRIYSEDAKSVALCGNGGGMGAKTGLYLTKYGIRRLTPTECERLQGLPDDYTEGISNMQRYKCLGNAFNVDVIAHILSFIPEVSNND